MIFRSLHIQMSSVATGLNGSNPSYGIGSNSTEFHFMLLYELKKETCNGVYIVVSVLHWLSWLLSQVPEHY